MIRKATINDIFSLDKIESEVLTNTLGINFLLNEIENNDFAHYFVYELNKEIIGYIGVRIYDDICEVFNFVVKKNYQNQGYGKKLFNYLLQFIKDFNVETISLEVRKSNKAALRFYYKNDFIKSHIRKNYYLDEDAIVLIKEVE